MSTGLPRPRLARSAHRGRMLLRGYVSKSSAVLNRLMPFIYTGVPKRQTTPMDGAAGFKRPRKHCDHCGEDLSYSAYLQHYTSRYSIYGTTIVPRLYGTTKWALIKYNVWVMSSRIKKGAIRKSPGQSFV